MSDMDPSDEDLDSLFPYPCGDHLATLGAFFLDAKFNRNGTATVTFTIPREMKSRLIGLSENSGHQLNMRIWEQDVDVDAEIASLLGKAQGDEQDDEGG